MSGRTPLHEAARAGALDAVISLTEQGADVHAEDAWGATPLWDALRHVGVTRYLLHCGAAHKDFRWLHEMPSPAVVRMTLLQTPPLHVPTCPGCFAGLDHVLTPDIARLFIQRGNQVERHTDPDCPLLHGELCAMDIF